MADKVMPLMHSIKLPDGTEVKKEFLPMHSSKRHNNLKLIKPLRARASKPTTCPKTLNFKI